MREFRCWDGKKGYVYFTFRDIENGVVIKDGHYLCVDCDDEDHEIEQFTGLQDIKKKDVYENDKAVFNGRKTGIVKMIDGIWVVEDIEKKFTCFLYRVKQLEITGNIHQVIGE